MPAKPPGTAAFLGVAISTFIGLPSQSDPLRPTAAAAAEALLNVRKPEPLNLPLSECVSQSIDSISPAEAKTSFIQSSVIEKGRLPTYTRVLASPVSAATAGGAATAGSSAAFSFFFSFFSCAELTVEPCDDSR